MKTYLILGFLLLTINTLHSQEAYWTLLNSGVDNRITAIAKDQDSAIWLGTQSAGLIKYADGVFTIFNSQNSPFTDSYIWALAVDQQNNIWIATQDTGLVKFDGNEWYFYNMNEIAPRSQNNSAWEVEIDDSNNIWVGTYWAGLAKFDGQNWTLYDDSNSPMINGQMEINAISFDKSGNLWYGSDHRGFGMFDRVSFWEIYDIMMWIYCIAIESTNDVWFNGSDLVRLSADSVWSTYGQYNIQRFSNYAIAVDANDRKWMAQADSSGIFLVEDDNFSLFYPQFPEIQNARTYSVYIDKENTKWIGYTNGYLLKYTGDYPVGISNLDIQLPNRFYLSQNYPNPFNPSTKISWQSPVGSHQTIKVFDVLGKEIATLVDEYRDAGSYEVNFNASSLSSGIYFYQLNAGAFVKTMKMTYLR
ncbi:MAG: T9SS type A sorting domain-containing protein [Ignavibacterium sp.]|nr:T9SS type A sorting domain-containing protein [Ignavibacterium sp.]